MQEVLNEEVVEETTAEEVANEEAAEKLAEESTDLARELAEEDKDPGEEGIPEGYRVATPEELKAIKDFEELFGQNAHPLTVMVGLANRIKELENKVF